MTWVVPDGSLAECLVRSRPRFMAIAVWIPNPRLSLDSVCAAYESDTFYTFFAIIFTFVNVKPQICHPPPPPPTSLGWLPSRSGSGCAAIDESIVRSRSIPWTKGLNTTGTRNWSETHQEVGLVYNGRNSFSDADFFSGAAVSLLSHPPLRSPPLIFNFSMYYKLLP